MKYNAIPSENLVDIEVVKKGVLGNCHICGSETEWFDNVFQVYSCSQTCSRTVSKNIIREFRELEAQVYKLEKKIIEILGE